MVCLRCGKVRKWKSMEDWRMEDGGWKMEEINKYLVNRCPLVRGKCIY